MQWLSKKTVMVVLSVCLASMLLIKHELKVSDNIKDKITVIEDERGFASLKLDQVSSLTNKVDPKPDWSDRQLVGHLNNQDPLVLLKALSHVWIHIDNYNKHGEIMARVRFLSKHNSDNRISGLASLVGGELVRQVSQKKNVTLSNDDWERFEQEKLVWDEDRSESDYENQSLSYFDTIDSDSINKEERVQYIDDLVSKKDDSSISELSALILDTDEEVSVAAIDALILNLEQGIGDPAEIGGVLEENMAFLDELQIQTIEELSDNFILDGQ